MVALARCRYDALVEVDSAAAVRDLEPGRSALRAGSGRGVIVTAANELPDVDADPVRYALVSTNPCLDTD